MLSSSQEEYTPGKVEMKVGVMYSSIGDYISLALYKCNLLVGPHVHMVVIIKLFSGSLEREASKTLLEGFFEVSRWKRHESEIMVLFH